MFVSRLSSIYEYTLSTSFDPSTASSPDTSWYAHHNSYGISNYGSYSTITGMQYNNDGTKLFTVHQRANSGSTAKIVEWSLSTAYDPTTASTNADFNDTSTYFETGETTGSAGNGVPTQFITFNNDGSKMFISTRGNANKCAAPCVHTRIWQYSLSTNFDISTATYSNIFFSVANEVTKIFGSFEFNSSRFRISSCTPNKLWKMVI